MRRLTLQVSSFFSLFTSISSFNSDAHEHNSFSSYLPRPTSSLEEPNAFEATSVADRNIWEHEKSRRRRMKKGLRPPLVDSDLLRFLNEQKKLTSQKQQSKLEKESSCLPLSLDKPQSSTIRVSFHKRVFNSTFAAQRMPMSYLDTLSRGRVEDSEYISLCSSSSLSADQIESDNAKVTKANNQQLPIESRQSVQQTFFDAVVDDDNIDNSWLGQYNHHRVASVLLARGNGTEKSKNRPGEQLDPQLASRAGERVQSKALSRTARRRVRSFLKKRDQKWTEPIGLSESMNSTIFADEKDDKNIAVTVAPVSVDESTYGFEDTVDVLVEYGLTIKDICEILIHSPGVALMRPRAKSQSNGESLQETTDRAFSKLLCGTLALRKYDARKVLRNSPNLLTMRGSRSAEQVVKMLSQLGVSTNSIARDKNGLSTLLSRPPSEMFRLVAFLSSDAVRMPFHKIGPLLRRCECQSLLDVVAPIPHLETREFGMLRNDDTDPEVVAALWDRSSQQRRQDINDVYRHMSKTAWTLRHEIGTSDLGKVIAAYPSVLLQDAESQILPAANFLMNELGIWKDDLPRVLQLHPALLGIKVEAMREVAEYMMSLEVEQDNLGTIFRSFPALLTLDIKRDMMPVVEFLRSIGINNIGRFVTRLPSVLGYSIDEELRPKWAFLQSLYVDPCFEATKFPAYFSYPLERVTKSRFFYLRRIKRLPTQLVALDQVLRYGDIDFATKVAGDTDKGVYFISFLKERQKGMMQTALLPRER